MDSFNGRRTLTNTNEFNVSVRCTYIFSDNFFYNNCGALHLSFTRHLIIYQNSGGLHLSKFPANLSIV